MIRRGLVVAVVVGALTLLAAPASAHVVLDRSEVAAGSTSELEFRAPIERQGTTNRKLYALVPGPIAVTSCSSPSATWRCTIDTTTRPGDTFVTWETPVAGSPQDLRFRFVVTVPADAPTGERKLPVVQTYADGTVSRWIDDGEPTPAPRLTVIGVGQRPAPPAPAPSASSHSSGRPAAPAATAAPTTGVPGPSVSARPSAVATVASTATSSAVAAPLPGATASSVAVVDRGGESEDTGGGFVLVALGGLALAAVVGSVIGVLRRRSAP